MSTLEQLSSVARELLPPPAVEPWISVLRPGIQLTPAADGDLVVGRFGGDPLMPPDAEWPTSPYTPLNLLLTLDLARFPGTGLGLPTDGLLTFFAASCGEMAGAVRYYPPESRPVKRETPEHANEFPFTRLDLTAVEHWTVPDPQHPYLSHIGNLVYEFEDENSPPEGTPEYDEYLNSESAMDRDEYFDATTPDAPSHLIGGYGRDVQYSADYAPTAEPVPVPTRDGPVDDTELPILLAQIDSDRRADIQWGDFGTALWTISREDMAARRFHNATHHWNCH